MKLRLEQVARALGMSASKLSISIGRSSGYINSLKGGIASTDLSKIIEMYPMVNRNFILNGEGEPIKDDVDTLAQLPESYEPESDNYRELCMAYRQDLADTREDLRKTREAYFALMEQNNRLLSDLTRLQTACIAAGVPIESRDNSETEN